MHVGASPVTAVQDVLDDVQTRAADRVCCDTAGERTSRTGNLLQHGVPMLALGPCNKAVSRARALIHKIGR